MRTLPSYQRARLESLHRSPWALVVAFALAAAVLLLGQEAPGGAAEPTPAQPSVTAPDHDGS